jgi:hypothetical protein
MTAAIANLMRPSPRTSLGDWPARVLTVLALVLPIPFCSALGLSLPLPATVARIAAKLVPFANSAGLDTRDEQVIGARGSIVAIPGEAAGNGRSSIALGGSPTLPGPRSAGGGDVPGGKVDGSTTANVTANTPAAGEHDSSAPRQTDPIAGPTLPSGSPSTPPNTSSTPPQGGSDPVPPSAPPTVVNTATAAATTVVETASATVTTATATVTATVAPTLGAVGGAAGSVLPPKKP